MQLQCPPCTCRARVRWRDVLDSAWLAHTQSVSHVEVNQVAPRISSASNGSGAGGYVVVWLRKPRSDLGMCLQPECVPPLDWVSVELAPRAPGRHKLGPCSVILREHKEHQRQHHDQWLLAATLHSEGWQWRRT